MPAFTRASACCTRAAPSCDVRQACSLETVKASAGKLCCTMPSCRAGVKPYTTAVAALFDPEVSHADLLASSVSGPNTITLRWRLEGRLKLGMAAAVSEMHVLGVQDESRKRQTEANQLSRCCLQATLPSSPTLEQRCTQWMRVQGSSRAMRRPGTFQHWMRLCPLCCRDLAPHQHLHCNTESCEPYVHYTQLAAALFRRMPFARCVLACAEKLQRCHRWQGMEGQKSRTGGVTDS